MPAPYSLDLRKNQLLLMKMEKELKKKFQRDFRLD